MTETDIDTGQVHLADPVSTNPFSAGHAQLEDGSILVAGGDPTPAYDIEDPPAGYQPLAGDGLRAVRKYIPCAYKDKNCVKGRWEYHTDMTRPRWNPTITTLYTGRAIIVSGSLSSQHSDNEMEVNNPTFEYFPPKTGEWPSRLDILDRQAPNNLHPHVFQLHNKRVLLFVGNETLLIDTAEDRGDSTISCNNPVQLENKRPWSYPYTPTSVMMPLTRSNGWTSKIMFCGGSENANGYDKADDRCISIDFGDEHPEWNQVESMPDIRLMPDCAILPDGKILFSHGARGGRAVGDAGEVQHAWDPAYSKIFSL